MHPLPKYTQVSPLSLLRSVCMTNTRNVVARPGSEKVMWSIIISASLHVRLGKKICTTVWLANATVLQTVSVCVCDSSDSLPPSAAD